MGFHSGWRKIAILALVLLPGCGDGGREGAAPSAPAEPTAPETTTASNDGFCRSAVEMEEAVFRAATGGTPPPIEPLVDDVEESAPAELEGEVGAVVSAVRQTLEEGDDAALRDPGFGANEERIDAWIGDNCGFESVDASGTEYAFEGMPKMVPAGITTFHFANEGEEPHEMLAVRIVDDRLGVRDLGRLSGEEAENAIEYLGSAFAMPGETDVDTRTLVPGRYGFVCLLPVGSTGPPAAGQEGGPSHFDRGMWAEVVVR